MGDGDHREEDPGHAQREQHERPEEAPREDHLAGERDRRELVAHVQREDLGEVLAVDEQRESALTERAERDEGGEDECGIGRTTRDEAEEVDGDHHEREAQADDNHREGEGGGEEGDGCGVWEECMRQQAT